MKYIRTFNALEDAVGKEVDIPVLVWVENMNQAIGLDSSDDTDGDGKEVLSGADFYKVFSISEDGCLMCDDPDSNDGVIENSVYIDNTGNLVMSEELEDYLGIWDNKLRQLSRNSKNK